jgi:hypothetical protein
MLVTASPFLLMGKDVVLPADNFDSNLMMQNFMVANVSRNVNNVVLYMVKAKGWMPYAASALSFVVGSDSVPKRLFLILDYCVRHFTVI